MDSKSFLQHEHYFTKPTFALYQSGYQAYLNEDYLSAVVWGAVFIEAFLKDILTELGVSHEGDDLNQMISKVKKIQKHATVTEHDKNQFVIIGVRCDEIRMKRNRIVHDIGTHRGDISADAKDIYSNSLSNILELYIKTSVAVRASKKNALYNAPPETVKAKHLFPVFISTISPHTFEQEMFIEAFCNRLREIDVEPVRCSFGKYDYKDPMEKVRKDIAACNAVIVVGLNRHHACYYVEKEGANIKNEKGKYIETSEGLHRYFSSGWLQLECGIGIGQGKHIFVLCQENIHSEGIFDRDWNSFPVTVMDGPLDANHPSVDELLDDVKQFKENPDEYLRTIRKN